MTLFDPTAEIDDDHAIALIRAIVAKGSVIIGKHVKKRMSQRGYLNTQDVTEVLETGVIVSKEFDEVRNNWKYKVEGADTEGEEGTVVTAIISISSQQVITVF